MIRVDQRFPIGGARKNFWGCEKNLPILTLMNGIVDSPKLCVCDV